jgi:acetylornithine/N-succinyldiaminopimelate aminotransferase
LDSVKEQASEKTCAVIMETVQGEGGIYPAEKEFIEGVAKLCRERDILFILDEIQCGMGRSGKMFAWQHYDVKPDIMAAAKALGCGVPVGAFVMTERVAQKSLVPGDHGTTYGGNPFAGAAVRTVLEIMERDKITEHVQEIGGYLWERLEGLRRKHECIVDHRGIGLMQGLSVSVPVGEVSRKALEKGLVLITAGADVIRFVPPLVIEEEHVDLMVQILDGILP